MRNIFFNNGKSGRVAALIAIALAMLVYLSYGESRMYWPYMLGTFVLMALIYLAELKQLPQDQHKSFFAYMFPKEIWLHPSTIHECIFVTINFFLLYALFSCVSVFNLDTSIAFVQSALGHSHLDGMKSTANPSIPVMLFFAMAAMVSGELFFYIVHRLQHTVPVLWELHKVHHSAKVLTPLTLYRVHPLSFLLDAVFFNFGFGVVMGIFLYLYPAEKSVIVVGITAVGYGFLNVAGGNLHHSHIWMRFPRVMEKFITSPAMHQIHHSTNPEHFNKNYARFFSMWDRVFGSIYIPNKKETITLGLGNYKGDRHETVWELYADPIRQITKRLRRAIKPS